MTRAVRFTEADIARVLRAAIKTGARVLVEVTPDGTIKIQPNPPDQHRQLAKPLKIDL